MTSRIAFATCDEYADLDPDDRLLIPPLARLGVSVEPAVWNDPTVDWGSFDAVILRSTWDYPEVYAAFLAWAASVRRLINPIDIVRWTTDKRYLLHLEAAGIPVVPTRFVDPGDTWRLPRDWSEVVVKPATSAGSRDTARYDRADPGVQSHVHRLGVEGRVTMLQPYLDGVELAGETALVYAAGTFSHAIRKGPLLQPGGLITEQLFAPEEISGRTPTADELTLGDRVMNLVIDRFGPPAYARVDLLPGPVLIEVELAEPSLFLAHGPGSPDRFAIAIASALGEGR